MDKKEKLARWLCDFSGIDPDSTERKQVLDDGIFRIPEPYQYAWECFQDSAQQVIDMLAGPKWKLKIADDHSYTSLEAADIQNRRMEFDNAEDLLLHLLKLPVAVALDGYNDDQMVVIDHPYAG